MFFMERVAALFCMTCEQFGGGRPGQSGPAGSFLRGKNASQKNIWMRGFQEATISEEERGNFFGANQRPRPVSQMNCHPER
jgi:hypothetical protein